jgi:hypothetical protein
MNRLQKKYSYRTKQFVYAFQEQPGAAAPTADPLACITLLQPEMHEGSWFAVKESQVAAWVADIEHWIADDMA